MNQKEILLISLTVFFTIIAWLIFDIYQVRTENNVLKNYSVANSSLDYKIDPQVLSSLKQKNL